MFDNAKSQHPARESVLTCQFFLVVRMPHKRKARIRIEPPLSRRKSSRASQKWASGIKGSKKQVFVVREDYREWFPVVSAKLPGRRILRSKIGIIGIACAKGLSLGNVQLIADVIKTGTGPIDIPPKVCSRPCKESIEGLAGPNCGSKGKLPEICACPQQPAISGDHTVMVSMQMVGMKVPRCPNDPEKDRLLRMGSH
jgi:hypothetical protein